MQNEGETDNRKAMIMVPFDDFSVPSKSRVFIFSFIINLPYNSSSLYTTIHSCYTHACNNGFI